MELGELEELKDLERVIETNIRISGPKDNSEQLCESCHRDPFGSLRLVNYSNGRIVVYIHHYPLPDTIEYNGTCVLDALRIFKQRGGKYTPHGKK
jgi:hypothetical protein